MPTSSSPGTNQYVCEACGRHLNTKEELTEHARECMTAKQSGSGQTKAAGANQREEGEDRDWVSTP